MDQLKTTLRYLKRVHFWVLCPLVILIGFAFWHLAVGKLNGEKEENLREISNNYNVARGVLSQTPHPNQEVADEMDKLILKTREEIAEAWRNKTTQQEEVLTWPQDLPAEFLRTVEPLRPIEREVSVTDPDRLNVTFRERYRYYIENELPKLAELAGARWVVRFTNERGTQPDKQQTNTLVDWSREDQEKIRKKHFEWKGRGAGGRDGTPSTLDILYAQEDLLVLRHLMQIINRTNENAATRHSAAIRKIFSIDIGRQAVYSDVEVETIAEDKDKKKKDRKSGDKANPNSVAGAIPDPAEGRYVDENYEPLSAEILRQVMQSGEVSPEQAYLAVAKRIPVRLRVSMDQRKINKLLVECANSELTVEVRQLLINKDYQPGQGVSGAGVMGGNLESRGFGGGGGIGQPNRNASNVDNSFPYDLDVEVYGIVYIYNPVDNAALGLETGETDSDTATADASGVPTTSVR